MIEIKQTVSQQNRLVAETLALLDQQILQTLEQLPKKFKLPRRKWKQVVVCGMGGSTLGADLLRYAMWQELKVPVIIVNNYNLPHFVNRDTLVIISSYSGTTAEAISCLKEAQASKFPTLVIASGKTLISFARQHRLPYFQFDTSTNPSKQPRFGLGYAIAVIAAVLIRQGLTSYSLQDIKEAALSMKKVGPALVRELLGKSVFVIASEHLLGSAHIMSNQLNETVKVYATYYALPELNHHLLEGLDSLKSQTANWAFVFIDSDSYQQQTIKRYKVTKAIIKKQGFKVYSKKFSGDRLEQVLKMVYWSSSLTFQLAEKSGLDATAIPWVNYFKKQMRARHSRRA